MYKPRSPEEAIGIVSLCILAVLLIAAVAVFVGVVL